MKKEWQCSALMRFISLSLLCMCAVFSFEGFHDKLFKISKDVFSYPAEETTVRRTTCSCPLSSVFLGWSSGLVPFVAEPSPPGGQVQSLL